MAERARGRAPRRRPRSCGGAARSAARARAYRGAASAGRSEHAVREHDRDRARSPSFPATSRSSSACARSCAGTRWRWWLQANAGPPELGGHIASYAVGRDAVRGRLQSLLARAARDEHGGDLVFFQGHSSPGHLRARVPRRPPRARTQLRQLPPGGRRAAASRRIRIRG